MRDTCIIKKKSLGIITIIIIIITCVHHSLAIIIILALTAALTNISTGQVLGHALKSARRAVSFASASDHFKDGLWGWEDHCGHWFDHAINLQSTRLPDHSGPSHA